MSKIINVFKRTASLCVAVLMVITALPQLAVTTFAAEVPEGYTTDSYGLMAWRQINEGWGEGSNLSYDVKGYVNGDWKRVTYGDGGFHSMVWPQTAQSSVQITCTPSFVVEGQAVMFTYNVTNTGEAPVSNFRFFLASDTAIDGYDASSNTVDEDNVITMSRNETGVSLFAFSTTEGGIAIPTEYWDGEHSYGKALEGEDPSLTDRVATARDSAFVTYFPLTTLAPGQSAEYTLVVGMADKSAIAGIINSVKKALLKTGLDYENECLKDLTPGGTYILKDRDNGAVEYEVKAGEDGTIPLTGTDVNGNAYDFIGKTITIYQKGEGDVADSAPLDVEVAGRPDVEEPSVTFTPENVNSNDIHTTNNTIQIKAVVGQEYRLNDGQWVSPGADGTVTFEGLDELTSYTIYTRVKATKNAPASVASDGVEVRTYGMFDPVSDGYDNEYDGSVHVARVNTSVADAKITYALNPDGPYREKEYQFIEPGKYTVYYKIEKENYYDAIGSIVINIEKKDLAPEEQARIEGVRAYTSRIVVSEVESKSDDVLYAISRSQYPPTEEDAWQTSNVFDDLEPNSTYYVFTKIPETDHYKASISEPFRVTTTEEVDKKDLKVSSKVPEVVVDNGTTGIQIGGQINALDKVDEVVLQYRKVGSNIWTTIPMYTAADVEKDFSCFLGVGGKGLDYDTTYEYQYIVKTSVTGETQEVPSDIFRFQTPKNPADQKKVTTGKVVSEITNGTTIDRTYTVSIEKGNTVLQSKTVDIAAGKTVRVDDFDGVAPGTYNIVIRDKDGGYIETRTIDVKANKTSDAAVSTAAGPVKSKVNIVNAKTADVAVNGLHDIITAAEIAEAATGSKGVEITLDVEDKTDASNISGQKDIESVLKSVNDSPNTTVPKEVKKILDLSLYKTRTDYDSNGNALGQGEKTNIGSQNSVVLEIAIPYDDDYKNIGIIRYHEDAATMFVPLSARPTSDYADETFYVGDGYIYIYSNKFSTYAIVADDEKATPNPVADNTDTTEVTGNTGSGIMGVTYDTVVPEYVFQQQVTYVGRRVTPPKTGQAQSGSSNSGSNVIIAIDMWLSEEEDDEEYEE